MKKLCFSIIVFLFSAQINAECHQTLSIEKAKELGVTFSVKDHKSCSFISIKAPKYLHNNKELEELQIRSTILGTKSKGIVFDTFLFVSATEETEYSSGICISPEFKDNLRLYFAYINNSNNQTCPEHFTIQNVQSLVITHNKCKQQEC